MKVALSTIGKFHTFDLARELHARGALTGYPRFKLRDENLPQELIRTFSFVHGAYMAFPWRGRIGRSWLKQWEYLDQLSFGVFAARNLPECDVYVGLSGLARRDESQDARRVSNIRVQDQIEREEHERWGMAGAGVDPRNHR